MIAITIGKILIETLEKQRGEKISIDKFFKKEYLPLFFDNPKYMITGGNSPLENGPKIQWKKGKFPDGKERKGRINKFLQKIDDGKIDASTALGFPAASDDKYAPTSGCVSDIKKKYTKEEAYLTWIGTSLSVCVNGGLQIFFYDPQILLDIYKGWQVYRNILNDSGFEKLKGLQINTWNGQWINFFYSDNYRENFDYARLVNLNILDTDKDGTIKIQTVLWNKLLFTFAQITDKAMIYGYVCNYGQTNTTVGFIPFFLNKAKNILRYYKELFGESAAIRDAKTYENLFMDFDFACKFGAIGMHSLEPKGLRDYYRDKELVFVSTNIKPKKGESEESFLERQQKLINKNDTVLITYKTYKTWLLAMITKDKKENLKYSKEIANILYEYTKNARVEKNFVKETLFKKSSKKEFMKGILELMEKFSSIDPKKISEDKITEYIIALKELTSKIYLMNQEEFGYLYLLIKIDYSYIKKTN